MTEVGEDRDCSGRALLKSNLFIGLKTQYLLFRECIFSFLGAANCETRSLVISPISENKLYRLQQGKRTCNAHKIPVRSCFLPRNYAHLQFNVSVREYLK